jgi:type III secretion protein D
MSFLFKLRLLNGPLVGRELALPAGEFTLGQGDVDLQVPLEGLVPDRRVVLLVSEQGVFLTSKVACWIGGEPWEDHTTPLPLAQVIDLAGQGLLLGLVDSSLPLHPMPLRIAVEPQQKAVIRLSQTAAFQEATRRWGRWGWQLGAITLTIGSLLGGGSWLLSAMATDHNKPTQTELTPWLTQQLQQPALSGLSFAWESDGTIRFKGHCLESQPLNSVMLQLRRYGILLREPMICQDQLLNNIRYVLNLFGYEQVTVAGTDQPGVVAIRGAIQADERWRQVVDMLAVMPGLSHWSVENQGDKQLKSLLIQLRKAKLLGKLSISRSGDRLVVSGRLTATQQSQLKQQLAQFSQKWEPAPVVIYQNIRPSEERQQLFPAAIVSVGGCEQNPFIELATGQRLQVGARLPNGYHIIAIDGVHGVELSREGQLVHVPLDL